MRIRLKYIFFLFFLIAQLFFVNTKIAFAQTETSEPEATESAQEFIYIEPNSEPLNLTISPATLLLDTKPGNPVNTSFQVFNNSTETEYLKIDLLTFGANATGDEPVIKPFELGDDSESWLTFDNKNITVQPKTWKTVHVTFSPPESAALSYYYSIVISRQTSQTIKEGETNVVGAPALLLLATVQSPYAKQELQLKSFKTTKKIFEFLPVEFELTIQNTGNVHLAPVGNIFIDSSREKDVGLIQINRTNGLILPGSTRTYTLRWEDGFPVFADKQVDGSIVTDSAGNPKKELKWDFSKANFFRFGKYTAHLLFIFDNGERDVPTEAKLSFWVLPYRILVIFGLVGGTTILGIAIPLVLIFKRMRKQNEKKQTPTETK